MVFPFLASSDNISFITITLFASKPFKGSSKNNISGLCIRLDIKRTFCLIPLEKLEILEL